MTPAVLDEWSRAVSQYLIDQGTYGKKWTYKPPIIAYPNSDPIRKAMIRCGVCNGDIKIWQFTKVIRMSPLHSNYDCVCFKIPVVFTRDAKGKWKVRPPGSFQKGSGNSVKKRPSSLVDGPRQSTSGSLRVPRPSAGMPRPAGMPRSNRFSRSPTKIEIIDYEKEIVLALPVVSVVVRQKDYDEYTGLPRFSDEELTLEVEIDGDISTIMGALNNGSMTIKDVVKGRLPRNVKVPKPSRLIEDDDEYDEEQDIDGDN